MASPVLYEVNTRTWLRQLAEHAGRPIHLSEIPDEELHRWSKLGFTHIWMMGVWNIGPKSREVALKQWRDHWEPQMPSLEADVQGSPYAISDYSVDPRLGDPLSLLLLRDRFHAHGLKLILDFIPNHFGVDSMEPYYYPARFVQSPGEAPGFFPMETRFGQRWFAHGRDPYFPPWDDTIQLDYRSAETQHHMSAVAQTIAAYGDGLRCDMAMLLLPDIFRETWKDYPPTASTLARSGFWSEAIAQVKQSHPGAELIAEAYWGREAELQELGFDFTYNKRVTDMLTRGEITTLCEYLPQCAPGYLARSVHFLENHDEPRAASLFKIPFHKTAALLILSLPGMALLHDGQLQGRREFARIQMSKRPPEKADPELSDYYSKLLTTLSESQLREGKPEILQPEPIYSGETSFQNGIAVRWSERKGRLHFALFNLSESPVRFQVPCATGAGFHPEFIFGTGAIPSASIRTQENRLICEIPPCSGDIWRFHQRI